MKLIDALKILAKRGGVKKDFGGTLSELFAPAQNTFQPYAPAINGYDYTSGMNAGTQQQAAANAGQSQLANELEAQTAGKGPSLAGLQLQQATAQNIQGAAGAAASARGMNPAMAQRLAMQNEAATRQQAAGQAGLQRLQEQRTAQEQLGQVLAQQQQGANQMFGANVQGISNLNAATTTGQLGAQQLAAGIGAQNVQGANQAAGAGWGGMGTAMQSAARGGPIWKMDDGGDVPDISLGSLSDIAPSDTSLGSLSDIAPSDLAEQPEGVTAPADVPQTPSAADAGTLPYTPEQIDAMGAAVDAGHAPNASATATNPAGAPTIAVPPVATPTKSLDQQIREMQIQQLQDSQAAKQRQQYLGPIKSALSVLLGLGMVAANKRPFIPRNPIPAPQGQARGGAVKLADGTGSLGGEGSLSGGVPDYYTAPDSIQDPSQKQYSAQEDAVGSTLGSLISMLDTGGRVPGSIPPGPDSARNDVIPVLGTSGEIMIPKTIATAKDSPAESAAFIAAIKAGKNPKAAANIAKGRGGLSNEELTSVLRILLANR